MLGSPVSREPFGGERERRIPAPGVGAGNADALLEQKKRRFAAHAAAFVEKRRVAVGGPRRGIHEHDVERLERMADAVELALHVIGLADIAVRLGAEVELDAGGEEPLQRHLVDLPRRLAAVHRTGEMPWRVEMRAIVRGDRHTLDRRAFAVRQLFDLEAGEYLRELLGAFAVIDVLDARQHVRRIRSNAGFEGDGKVDDPHVHCLPCSVSLTTAAVAILPV